MLVFNVAHYFLKHILQRENAAGFAGTVHHHRHGAPLTLEQAQCRGDRLILLQKQGRVDGVLEDDNAFQAK